jgi:hypothetical protein
MLVFQGMLLAGGGVEHLRSGAICVWALKGLSVGVMDLVLGSGEPRGAIMG